MRRLIGTGLAAIMGCLLIALFVAPAGAGTMDFIFNGDCMDCGANSAAVAHLTVYDSYVLGTQLTAADIVALSYTSAIFPGGLTFSNFTSVSGSLQPDFSIRGGATDGTNTYQDMSFGVWPSPNVQWALTGPAGANFDWGVRGSWWSYRLGTWWCWGHCVSDTPIGVPDGDAGTFELLAFGLLSLAAALLLERFYKGARPARR